MAPWRVALPPARLDELRADPAFAEALTLARLANALRFALSAAFGDHGEVVGHRQRQSSFLLTAATLSEALHTLQRTGQYFRHLPAWPDQITPLLADSTVSDLRSRVLKWLRDKAVFHQDKDVPPIGLADLEGEWTVAEGDSEGLMDVHYPLADFVLLRAMLAQLEPVPNLVDAYEMVLTQTIELTKNMVVALDTLIGQVLNSYGLTWQDGEGS